MATKKITLNELRTLVKQIIKEETNLNKHVWEGWTVQDFIDELEPIFDMIISGNSWQPKFKTRDEIKKWCMDNQPYYKKYIKEVVDYFAEKAGV
jgi:hypothetical protein